MELAAETVRAEKCESVGIGQDASWVRDKDHAAQAITPEEAGAAAGRLYVRLPNARITSVLADVNRGTTEHSHLQAELGDSLNGSGFDRGFVGRRCSVLK